MSKVKMFRIHIDNIMRLKILMLLMLLPIGAMAQEFDEFFCDSTLRIDYIFAGSQDEQHIFLDKTCKMPGWHGRRNHLAELPFEGNGQIIVKDHRSQREIYRCCFSTLFQEWLSYDISKSESRSFENVYLVPYPKDTVDITVLLLNNRRETICTLTHVFNPKDILTHAMGDKPSWSYETIQQGADPSKSIDIAYIAEGYTADEMAVFLDDVRKANNALFDHEPFKSYKERFNVVAVKAESKESGTSIPGLGIWKNTILGSHFDTFYLDRYLTTLNIKSLHDCLAGVPYEHIIILVNTDNYGGGGILNQYNLSMSHHPLFEPVVVHEFGHSFGGLGDEYAYESEPIPMYPHDIEPWEPNLTTLTDFHGKWEDKIKKGTPIPTPESNDPKKIATRIGLFEGAGYSLKGVYRGMQDCRMRTNQNPEFCEVCRDALTKLIRFYTE